MSPQFEQIVIFAVMGVFVALFTWIYIRNPEQRIGLWMIGWTAILLHFAGGVLASYGLLNASWTEFISDITLEVAGVSFALSVSQVFATNRRRILYFLLMGLPSIVYAAFFSWSRGNKWIFPVLLIGSMSAVLASVWRYYRVKSASFYLLLVFPGVYALWSGIKSVHNPELGLIYFLTTFFTVSGFLYFQYYNRITPGVLTTSICFVLWGSVFPVAAILDFYHVGPGSDSMLWNLPKCFVAFGMILTLFENETVAATNAARQYRNLFEGNLAGVYISTVEGKILDCNSAFVHMYGYSSKEEMLAASASSFYCGPDDRKEFLALLRQRGRLIDYEERQRKKDGSPFWILERATLLPDASGQLILEGTAIDITERKQAETAIRESEERFATIFHHSPVACCIVSLDGVFLNGNAALAKLLGRSIEQIVGKTGVELGLWKSQQERDQFYKRLREEGSISNLDFEFLDASGNRHIGAYFGTLVRIADQEVIFGMQLDQTEERELRASYLQAQKMEAVGQLAGGVAHDFNNLLGIIGSYAELLEAQLISQEKLRAYCGKILETTARGRGLTSQLLTFSRTETSQPAPLEPNRAIREFAKLLRPSIRENIEIILELEATGDIIIDKVQFEQVILNVAVNASDAMPSGGQLTLATRDRFPAAPGSPTRGGFSRNGVEAPSPNGEGHRYVDIHIRDTGMGMDEATRLRAFEPFFTTKTQRNSNATQRNGNGLGLAIIHRIVESRRGTIDIESKPNEGTLINISLPAVEHREAHEEKHLSMEPRRGSGHILLVEDEVELRNTNAEFLSSIGYSISCAGSGSEALKLLEDAGQVDLVITDVVMPKMNGPDFARHVLQTRPNTRLLFTSGYGDDIVQKAGLSRSATPFLQKPYTLRQLGLKIREVLNSNGNK